MLSGTSISVQEGGILLVEFHTLSSSHKHWNFSAILAYGKNLQRINTPGFQIHNKERSCFYTNLDDITAPKTGLAKIAAPKLTIAKPTALNAVPMRVANPETELAQVTFGQIALVIPAAPKPGVQHCLLRP